MNIQRFFEKNNQNKLYNKWIKDINSPNFYAKHEYNPLISIIVPVFNVDTTLLIECIESVRNQEYSNWELCIADDASTLNAVKEVLEFYQSKDARIKVIYRKENGHICKATNSALEIASGEFIAFLDNDDYLSKDALSSVIDVLNDNNNYDFIYSDEDKVRGELHFEPAFKPDWSPQLLLSTNYTSHFSIYRKKIVDEIGGMDDNYVGAQDYDFVLRFTEQINSKNIFHVPKILYHWRVTQNSTASDPSAKNYANEAGRKALQAAINRRGLNGIAKNGIGPGFYQVEYLEDKKNCVTVIYIINSRENLIKELKKIRLILNSNVAEVFIALSQKFMYSSSSTFIEDFFSKNHKAKIIVYYFNNESLLSLYNRGAKLASSDFLFFLNDSLELSNNSWLSESVNLLYMKNIGSVSGTIVSKGKRVLASGWYINSECQLVPFYQGTKEYSKGYFGRLKLTTNITVGEINAFILKNEIYKRNNGFDETIDEVSSTIKFFTGILDMEFQNVCLPNYHFIAMKNQEYKFKNIEHDNVILGEKNIIDFHDPFKNNEFPLKKKK